MLESFCASLTDYLRLEHNSIQGEELCSSASYVEKLRSVANLTKGKCVAREKLAAIEKHVDKHTRYEYIVGYHKRYRECLNGSIAVVCPYQAEIDILTFAANHTPYTTPPQLDDSLKQTLPTLAGVDMSVMKPAQLAGMQNILPKLRSSLKGVRRSWQSHFNYMPSKTLVQNYKDLVRNDQSLIDENWLRVETAINGLLELARELDELQADIGDEHRLLWRTIVSEQDQNTLNMVEHVIHEYERPADEDGHETDTRVSVKTSPRAHNLDSIPSSNTRRTPPNTPPSPQSRQTDSPNVDFNSAQDGPSGRANTENTSTRCEPDHREASITARKSNPMNGDCSGAGSSSGRKQQVTMPTAQPISSSQVSHGNGSNISTQSANSTEIPTEQQVAEYILQLHKSTSPSSPPSATTASGVNAAKRTRKARRVYTGEIGSTGVHTSAMGKGKGKGKEKATKENTNGHNRSLSSAFGSSTASTRGCDYTERLGIAATVHPASALANTANPSHAPRPRNQTHSSGEGCSSSRPEKRMRLVASGKEVTEIANGDSERIMEYDIETDSVGSKQDRIYVESIGSESEDNSVAKMKSQDMSRREFQMGRFIPAIRECPDNSTDNTREGVSERFKPVLDAFDVRVSRFDGDSYVNDYTWSGEELTIPPKPEGDVTCTIDGLRTAEQQKPAQKKWKAQYMKAIYHDYRLLVMAFKLADQSRVVMIESRSFVCIVQPSPASYVYQIAHRTGEIGIPGDLSSINANQWQKGRHGSRVRRHVASGKLSGKWEWICFDSSRIKLDMDFSKWGSEHPFSERKLKLKDASTSEVSIDARGLLFNNYHRDRKEECVKVLVTREGGVTITMHPRV